MHDTLLLGKMEGFGLGFVGVVVGGLVFWHFFKLHRFFHIGLKRYDLYQAFQKHAKDVSSYQQLMQTSSIEYYIL